MPLPAPETEEFTQHLTTLEQHTRQDLEQSQQQAQEIRLLLGQTANEMEKLGQREIALANRVRDMEINLDSYSRADIRTLYNANHEVQLRLFMMRSQAEQLESRQQNLREYQDKLRLILDLIQSQQELSTSLSPQAEEMAARRTGSMIPNWQNAVAVIESQEEERLRLAREIQDGPTQSLTNLLLHLEVCRHVLKRDVDGAQKELDSLKGMLSTTLQETRRLLGNLRPLALEELGLVEMLRRQLNEVGRERGIEVNVNGSALTSTLPHHLQIALFRLLQGAAEALMVPGQGGRLTVALRSDADRVFAEVETGGPIASGALVRVNTYLETPVLSRRIELLDGVVGSEPGADNTIRLTAQFPVRLRKPCLSHSTLPSTTKVAPAGTGMPVPGETASSESPRSTFRDVEHTIPPVSVHPGEVIVPK